MQQYWSTVPGGSVVVYIKLNFCLLCDLPIYRTSHVLSYSEKPLGTRDSGYVGCSVIHIEGSMQTRTWNQVALCIYGIVKHVHMWVC